VEYFVLFLLFFSFSLLFNTTNLSLFVRGYLHAAFGLGVSVSMGILYFSLIDFDCLQGQLEQLRAVMV